MIEERDGIPAWLADLDDAKLRTTAGAATFARGLGYATDGSVIELTVEADQLSASVIGSERTPYRVAVFPPTRRAGMDWSSWCTCPVSISCKHAIAAVLVARRGGVPADGASASWERRLELLEPDLEAEGFRPIGLEFELVQAKGERRRRARVRPVVRGANGWTRSGISFAAIESTNSWRRVASESDQQIITDLLALVRSSHRTSAGSGSEGAIFLDALGLGAWWLLERALGAGMTLLAADLVHQVELAPTSFQPVADLRATEEGIEIRTVLAAVGGERPPPGALLLGAPAHAVAWEREGTVVLAAIEPSPLDAGVDQALGSVVLVPASEQERLLTRHLPRLMRRLHLSSADHSVELPEITAPRLVLEVRPGRERQVHLGWRFAYQIGPYELLVELTDPDLRPPRDVEAEQALLATRAELLGEAVHGPAGLLLRRAEIELRGTAATEVVGVVLADLEARGLEVRRSAQLPTYAESTLAPVISVSATESDDADWFDLSVRVTLGDETVPLADLLAALGRGEEVLALESGTWFRLDRPELHQLRVLLAEARLLEDRPTEELRLSVVQAGLWEELVALGVVAEQAEAWRARAGALVGLTEVPVPEVPASVTATLRPYQLEGFHWLCLRMGLGLGAILADDMGLGKTLQTLAMAAWAKEQGLIGPGPGPMLVVAPSSVVGGWASEAARFCPSLRVVVRDRGQRRSRTSLAAAAAEADLVVTSYAILRLDDEVFSALPWGAMVLDEAQQVKNHQAKTYRAARQVPAPVKLAITGTPLENSLMDLWSMLSIAVPGLFPNPTRFTEQFRRPIERGTDPERLEALRRRIRPLLLRRTKEEVATDLPPRTEQVLKVELSPEHRRLYDLRLARVRQEVLGLLGDLDRNRISVLSSLTTLRQLALWSGLTEDEAVPSAKIDLLVELLEELAAEGHRALVFSQFTRFLREVRDRLEAAGLSTCYLDGRTKDRAARIAEFTEGDAVAFCISLKAGGVGLNLTAADYVFLLDPWWNPAVEEQAADRAHRIGQQRPVVIYRLVSAGTIEEKVLGLQARKRQLFTDVVDGTGAGTVALSAEDLAALLEP